MVVRISRIVSSRSSTAPSNRSRAGSSATLHELAEALKHAFADRARSLGDPAFVDVPTKHLLDPAYARALAGRIGDKPQPSERYGDKPPAATTPPAPRAIDAPHDHGDTGGALLRDLGPGDVDAILRGNATAFYKRAVA